jgi:hypothetical protein
MGILPGAVVPRGKVVTKTAGPARVYLLRLPILTACAPQQQLSLHQVPTNAPKAVSFARNAVRTHELRQHR